MSCDCQYYTKLELYNTTLSLEANPDRSCKLQTTTSTLSRIPCHQQLYNMGKTVGYYKAPNLKYVHELYQNPAPPKSGGYGTLTSQRFKCISRKVEALFYSPDLLSEAAIPNHLTFFWTLLAEIMEDPPFIYHSLPFRMSSSSHLDLDEIDSTSISVMARKRIRQRLYDKYRLTSSKCLRLPIPPQAAIPGSIWTRIMDQWWQL